MKAQNNWQIEPLPTTLLDGTGIQVWFADAVDSNGKVWQGLASKVTLQGLTEKVFVGESAWSDAERFAFDMALSQRIIQLG